MKNPVAISGLKLKKKEKFIPLQCVVYGECSVLVLNEQQLLLKGICNISYFKCEKSHFCQNKPSMCTVPGLPQQSHHLKNRELEVTSQKCSYQEVDTKGNFVPLDIGRRQMDFGVLQMSVWSFSGSAATWKQKPSCCLYTSGYRSFKLDYPQSCSPYLAQMSAKYRF